MSTTAAHRVLATAELLAMIISSLKSEDDKGVFCTVKLAVVNRAFFHASIPVIWEVMHSFEPFCALLLPARKATPYSSGPSDDDLDRFDLYASKTKTLILNDRVSLLDHPCWAYYLGLCKARSNRLFPALRNLLLNSADALSVFIAFSVCSHIESLSVFLNPASSTRKEKGAIIELTSCIGRKNRSMTHLQLVYPTDAQSLRKISLADSLVCLRLTLDSEARDVVKPMLWTPRVVVIDEAPHGWELPSYNATLHDNTCRWRLEVTTNKRRGNQRKLSVMGSSRFHDMLMSSPCKPTAAQWYRAVHLTAYPPSGPSHERLSAATIAQYVSANPTLSSLTIQLPPWDSHNIHGATSQFLRSNASFHRTDPLWNQLMACRNLSTIDIDDVYFPTGDAIHRMIDLLQNLPTIRMCRFLPRFLSNPDEDTFVYPGLACLRRIALHCPSLLALALPLDLWETALPFLTSGIRSEVSNIRFLNLHPSPKGLLACTMAQSTNVAKYLYQLFPYVQSLANHRREGGPTNVFWSGIYLIISSFHFVRGETVRAASNSHVSQPLR